MAVTGGTGSINRKPIHSSNSTRQVGVGTVHGVSDCGSAACNAQVKRKNGTVRVANAWRGSVTCPMA